MAPYERKVKLKTAIFYPSVNLNHSILLMTSHRKRPNKTLTIQFNEISQSVSNSQLIMLPTKTNLAM